MAATPGSFADTVARSSLQEFVTAADRIRADVAPSPLLPFSTQSSRSIRLKAENLQPLGSFKIRCGTSALSHLGDDALRCGVATVSAGNFAQGLALAANRRHAHLTAHVPESAAGVKLDKLRDLGVTLVRHNHADWWTIAATRNTGADDGVFIHPVCEPSVIHGNGTIALELAQQWPELDTVVVPVGGGGLITGIALAFRALGMRVRIVGCEVEGAAPLAAARMAGKPVAIEKRPSFVDGIGSGSILEAMWPLLSTLVDDVVVVPVQAIKAALRTLAFENHLVVEGAGATALAAAVSARCRGNNIVAVLTGGNIDHAALCEILTASA